jgi:hypothetical protein
VLTVVRDRLTERLDKESDARLAAEQMAAKHSAKDQTHLVQIPKPKGSAGEGFSLRAKMELEGSQDQYRAIQVCHHQ